MRNLSTNQKSSDDETRIESIEDPDSPEVESVIIEKAPCEDSIFVPKKSRDLKEFETLSASGQDNKNIILTSSCSSTIKLKPEAKIDKHDNNLMLNSIDSLNYWQAFFTSKFGSLGK